MDRRSFLALVGFAASELPAAQMAAPPQPASVEAMTAGAKPAIALNHLGFVPNARKIVVYRKTAASTPGEFVLRQMDAWGRPLRISRPLTSGAPDLGDCLIGDFSDIQTEGMYQVTVGADRSVPFAIRLDVWRRTLSKAVSCVNSQRCGIAVPNRHPACHLDDARRRDTGEHVDVTGGWHVAGSLMKTGSTMLNGFGLLHLARNLGERWDPAGSGLHPLLEEMRWGNRYILKIQDADGLIWNDVAGGINGDSSDNRWTDNIIGNKDDRHINPHKPGLFQFIFITLQAMVAQTFRETDPGYAQHCLAAGVRCWQATQKAAGLTREARDFNWWTPSTELSWRTLAAVELYRATGHPTYQAAAAQLGQQLLSLQTRDFVGSQKTVRGFWRAASGDAAAHMDAVYSAMPPVALLELSAAFPNHADASRWRDAVRLHLEEYVLPLSARSVFGIVPYGVFLGSPTPEYHRPLAGEMTYRYFMPTRKQSWWQGINSHLECYALLLAMAAKAFDRRECRDLACRQLEWVMGANPFGACLMTGEGLRNPYPYSPFLGLITGGIMNGIAGNTRDEPVLDIECGNDWRTCEYWAPHNAFYCWALSVLEPA